MKWIDVKDELPEDNDWVLCFCKSNNLVFQCVGTGVGFDDETQDYCCYSGAYILTVTHWMPLPEPPKTEGQ